MEEVVDMAESICREVQHSSDRTSLPSSHHHASTLTLRDFSKEKKTKIFSQ